MVECIYQNDTSRMLIMKCIGSSQFYLEKVIMPSEIFLFNAPKEARLEIWRMSMSGQMLHVRADVSDYKTSPRDSNTEELINNRLTEIAS
ncbi:MAG: DUF1830 domain-containing protein [Synechococcus sp. SP1 MAG]|jgi:hypothetical protein|nr:DUF1830 domain-containing protein [Synechococcus sp. SP1 MAG]